MEDNSKPERVIPDNHGSDTRYPIERGLIKGFSYRYILELQRYEFNRRVELSRAGRNSLPDLIISVEHNPVYTLGRHADKNNLLISAEVLRRDGAEVVEIERGGDVTFHGEGQLVVYPILDLQRYHLGAKRYVELLEESVIEVLKLYGIKGEIMEGAPGVWIDKDSRNARKICAIGVTLKRFVSMHGLALNVNTDLSWFGKINPCGFTDKGVTSIAKETGGNVDFEKVAEELSDELIRRLNEIRLQNHS